jgi:hypothetical protein
MIAAPRTSTEKAKWARPVMKNEDPTKAANLAKRFNDAMAMALNKEPQFIDVHAIGISKVNRLFNIQHVHGTILRSIVQEGHDKSRPAVGICVEIREAAALAELIAHNQALSHTSPLMPKVYPEGMRYECLAATHYNVALRLGKDGHASPAGDLSKTKDTEQSFAEACSGGHRWIVLPESISESLKADICTWRNQDQNENQTITDGELVRLCKLTVEDFLSKAAPGTTSLPLVQIVTATCLKSTLRMNPSVVSGYARFVCQMAEERKLPLVKRYMDYWSGHVDPKIMSVPHSFFDGLSRSEVLKGKADVRLNLLITMCTTENATPRTRPTPDTCALISAADLALLGKIPFVVVMVQTALEEVRCRWRPILEGHMDPYEVCTECDGIAVLLVRAMCGKRLRSEWGDVPITTGKLTDDKMNSLFGFWSKHLDTTMPNIDFGNRSGLVKYHPTAIVDPTGMDACFAVPPLPLVTTRLHGKTAPAESASSASASGSDALPDVLNNVRCAPAPGSANANHMFRAGDRVKVSVRSSMKLPVHGNAEFMKDVRVGTECVVMQVAKDMKKVEIEADIMHAAVPVKIRDWINIKHLAYIVATTDVVPDDVDPDEDVVPDVIVNAHSTDRICQWVNDWPSLLEEDGPAAKMTFIKARVTLAMEMVMGRMPEYWEGEDLGVVSRMNQNGVPRTEVWTLKAFAPGKLMFAPYSNELKDRLYTQTASVHVGLPNGALPENRMLALEGRGKTHLYHGDAKHHVAQATGCMFWAIDRTTDATMANLVLEYCEVSSKEVMVHVPGLESKAVKFSRTSFPRVPVLVNKDKVAKHTKLVAMEDHVIKRVREEDAVLRRAAHIEEEHAKKIQKKT